MAESKVHGGGTFKCDRCDWTRSYGSGSYKKAHAEYVEHLRSEHELH